MLTAYTAVAAKDATTHFFSKLIARNRCPNWLEERGAGPIDLVVGRRLNGAVKDCVHEVVLGYQLQFSEFLL